MLLTGSQILIEVLVEQEVDTIFGYPGGHVLRIYDELGKNQNRINHILTSHEQGASHAADGYSRSSGKMGVCLATSGPGATNLVTGLATALSDSIPMIAITGNVPIKLVGTDSFQEIDTMSLTVAVTKHSFFVREVEKLADTVREAFKLAKSGRPGPVLIDIPQDVQMALCPFEPAEKNEPEEIENASKEKLMEAVEMINKAQRPIIYCGGGVINSESSQEVMDLAEKIDCYTSFSMMGLSAMTATNPRNLGMAGVYGRLDSTKAISKADLVIAAGARFADRATGNKEKFTGNAKIIHLDVDISEQGKILKADLNIIGNLKNSLKFLIENSQPKTLPQWKKEVEEIKEQFGEKTITKEGFTPREIIETVNSIVPYDTPVSTDVGQHQMWVSKYYDFKKPRTHLTSGGFGTMGYGMGAIVGASVATKKPSVLFTGDGSFSMNFNEVITAVRNKLPIIVVVLNNHQLGMICQLQAHLCQKNYFCIDLGETTDFVKLAEAFGAKGYRATNLKDLSEYTKKALNNKETAIIDCIIDKSEDTLPMLAPNGDADNAIMKEA